MNDSLQMTRRAALGASLIGAAIVAGWTSDAEAAEKAGMTATEKANIKVVEDFLKAWEGQSPDPQKLGSYLADDCSTRMSVTAPAVSGRAASVESFKPLISGKQTFTIKVVKVFAKGPVVMTSRVDTAITPGKPDQPFPVVGVFYVKDGKIKEWTDYPLPKT